jgi:hypothetical protein
MKVFGDVYDPEYAARYVEGLLAEIEQHVPPFWTPEYVGARLIEAFATHDMMPEPNSPKTFAIGNSMPAYEFDQVDRAGWSLEDQYAVRVRRSKATAAQIARMEVAFSWTPRFLGHDAEMASSLQHWAMWTSQELDVDRLASKCFWSRDGRKFDEMKNEGLRLIARYLNVAKEPVT